MAFFLDMSALQSLILYFSLFVSLFFEIFLLITYFESKEKLKLEKARGENGAPRFPTISIIVPCLNEASTVEKTIESIFSLNYPKDKLSLILIDDGSTDNTLEVLKRFENKPNVRVFSKQNEGSKFSALNFGLSKVNTELVGCLDADSFVDPQALKHIIPYFNDEEIMAVTPSIKVFEPKTILQYVQKMEYTWGIFLRRMLSVIGALYITPGPFSIFRVKVFQDLGPYKQGHHTEDMEIAMRMQKHHYKIVNAVDAYVYTIAPKTLRPLHKQRVRWTYGFLKNAFDYKEMFLNKNYGHIGLFILPIATFSIFSTLYMTGTFLWSGVGRIGNAVTKYQAVGWTWPFSNFSLDWFFINTGVFYIVATTTFLLALYLLFTAMRLANGKFAFGRDIVYYLTIYVFIVPLWLAKSVYNVVLDRKISWR
jgi:cellulose synthase/poly-beta-1,6-N-acetylglucosamine synthase-like glycosyltransferase